MRAYLEKHLGRRAWYRGTFAGYGYSDDGVYGEKLLLRYIEGNNGVYINHQWFDVREFGEMVLDYGDVVSFNARVGWYVKLVGMKGKTTGRPVIDYCLCDVEHVGMVEHPNEKNNYVGIEGCTSASDALGIIARGGVRNEAFNVYG